MKRIAIPRGSALGSVSGILGIPVEFENRTQIGVEGLLKWGAIESFPASAEGMKVPDRSSPLACAIMNLLATNFSSVD